MRILGFQKLDWMNFDTHHPKLLYVTFTTFRLARRDRDWEFGEVVRVVLKPRTKERLILGEAEIIQKAPKEKFGIGETRITDVEARADGFREIWDLERFLFFRRNRDNRTANKITLRWRLWYPPMMEFALRN